MASSFCAAWCLEYMACSKNYNIMQDLWESLPVCCTWRESLSSNNRAIVSMGHLHLLLSASASRRPSQRPISFSKSSFNSCSKAEPLFLFLHRLHSRWQVNALAREMDCEAEGSQMHWRESQERNYSSTFAFSTTSCILAWCWSHAASKKSTTTQRCRTWYAVLCSWGSDF